MSNDKAKQRMHRGIHLRPLLTPFEAAALIAALEGEALEGERLAGLERAKAKIGRAGRAG